MTRTEAKEVLRDEASMYNSDSTFAQALRVALDALERVEAADSWRRVAERLEDDALADAVVRDCKDEAHDIRWCSTCATREGAIDAYRRRVKGET